MARTKRTTPAPEPEDASTALALPDTPVLVAAYSDAAQMQAILKRIETEALAVAPDLSTATSRKAIASLAFKVARSKTALDEIGKEITEEARRTVDTVNAVRRDVRDRLDALKTKVRAPLDEWEAAEKARVDDLEDRMRDFTHDLPGVEDGSAAIAETIREIETIPVDDTWAEFRDKAEAAKANTLHVLRDMLTQVKVREAERAELERLRAEAAEREAAEQRRLAKERLIAEAERIEREKAEAAERAAKAAEERAAREAAEAEARHKREMEAAAERERLAAQRERERIVAEQAAAEAERKAREADQARRYEVSGQIELGFYQALEAFTPTNTFDSQPTVGRIVQEMTEAIMAGRIPHVKVEM